VVPIVYGWLAGDLWEREERGEIKVGGDIVMPYRWHCKDCQNDWE